MKFTVAVLAALAITLAAAPVMASVADSAGSNSGYDAHRRHHHHHHRRHHMNEGLSDSATQSDAAIA